MEMQSAKCKMQSEAQLLVAFYTLQFAICTLQYLFDSHGLPRSDWQSAIDSSLAEQTAVSGLHGVQVTNGDRTWGADDVDRRHQVVRIVAMAVDSQRVAEFVLRYA